MAEALDPGDGWARYFGGLFLTRRRGAFDAPVLGRLRRARDFMAANPGAPIDLDQLAGTAHFSKFHFLRLFRQAYGETPARYLAQLRLERARELLSTTDRTVTEICFDVGYESLASFSHAFSRHAGAAPQQYRRWLVKPRPRPRLLVPGCFVAMYAG